nr:hypothetical protein Iba_chr06eCG9120 [Ipomoea batatas]
MEKEIETIHSNMKGNLNEFLLQLMKMLGDESSETFTIQQNKNILKVVHQNENQLRDVQTEIGSINTKASQGSKIQQPKILTVPKGLKKASLGDQALWVAE